MPTPDVVPALAQSYLFRDLSAGTLESLAHTALVRRLGIGEALCEPGDPADELYVVMSGEVKDSVVSLDGDEVVHFLHGPGMTLGEPGYFAVERNRILRVAATAPSTVAGLHRRALEPLLRGHPELKDRVLERLAANTRWQTNMISALATRPLADRLVLRLLELADTNSADGTGAVRTPKVSQATLAAMTGVSRENVNRALATLIANGTIRRERGSYVVLDEAGLRSAAARDWLPVRLRDKRTQV